MIWYGAAHLLRWEDRDINDVTSIKGFTAGLAVTIMPEVAREEFVI